MRILITMKKKAEYVCTKSGQIELKWANVWQKFFFQWVDIVACILFTLHVKEMQSVHEWLIRTSKMTKILSSRETKKCCGCRASCCFHVLTFRVDVFFLLIFMCVGSSIFFLLTRVINKACNCLGIFPSDLYFYAC